MLIKWKLGYQQVREKTIVQLYVSTKLYPKVYNKSKELVRGNGLQVNSWVCLETSSSLKKKGGEILFSNVWLEDLLALALIDKYIPCAFKKSHYW